MNDERPLRCPEGHPIAAGDTACPVCQTLLTPPVGPPPSGGGPQFAGYEVLAKLGEGGMGEVFRVRNLELHREEAIKRIRSASFATPEQRAAFRREAEAVAKVQHPGIVHIHHVGEADGHPFFAMEFVAGGSLGRRAGDRPLPFREAADVVRKLAEALNVAHQQRLVHLDLKPDNVLMTPEGEPKIADFGLARVLESDDALLRDWVGGTPGYMAPEQFAGRGTPIGPAADIFALGATLYRLLVGRPPIDFSATPGERTVRDWRDLLDRSYRKTIVPPRTLRPEIPPDLDAICMRCLRSDPQARYPSAASLADDLGRHLRYEPTAAYATTWTERLSLWRRRRPAVAALTIFLIVAVVVGLASTSYFAWDAYAQATEAGKAKSDAENKARAAREEADARQRAKRLADRRGYVANLRLVQMAWEANQPDRIRPLLLQQLPEQTDGIDLRGFEWHFWNRLSQTAAVWEVDNMCTGVAFDAKSEKVAAACMTHVGVFDPAAGTRTRLPISAWTVAFHPSGDRLVAGGEGIVSIWDLKQGKAVETIASLRPGRKAWMRAVAVSPDGKTLAWGDGPDLFVRAWNGGEAAKVSSPGDANAVAFSPDGLRIAVGGDDGIVIADAETRKVRTRLSRDLCKSLAFGPKSDRLVAAGDRVAVWDLAAETARALPQPDEPIDGVAFSADGRTVAAACYDRVVRLWDAARGNEKGTLRSHTRRVTSVAFSPDGKHLASGAMDDTVRLWPADQEPGALPLPPTKWLAKRVVFAGQRMIRGGEDVTAYDLPSGKAAWSAVPPTVNAEALAASADGSRLLLGADSPKRAPKMRLILFDAADGKEIRVFEGPENTVGAVAFHPNGDRFASVDFDDRLMLWSVDDPKPRTTVQLERSRHPIPVAYRNAAQLVVADPKGNAIVCDAATGKELFRLGPHEAPILALACSADGALLATASDDRTIKLWDLEKRVESRTLEGHVVGVTGVAFSPDGKRLASVSIDRTLRLWDVTVGQEVLSLASRDLPFTSVAFSGDGRYLATCAFGTNWRTRTTQTCEVRVWYAPR